MHTLLKSIPAALLMIASLLAAPGALASGQAANGQGGFHAQCQGNQSYSACMK